MRETLVVMRRELRSYFISPIAYVFGALFLAISLWGSRSAVSAGVPASISALLNVLPWLFALFLPLLTMRLWAEEKKFGTLELLMTFPVRISHLVAGKFLAAMAFLALLLAMTLGLPWTLDHYGELDWGPVVAGYLAALMLASSYVSAGMFFSSLTREQIVAALVSIAVLVVLNTFHLWVVVNWFESLGMPDWCVDTLGGLSPFRYFASIERGVIDSRDVTFYAVFCGFFLYANGLVLRGRRLKG